MNVTCSHCHTIFRVDPHKVPAEGVRARCSVCRGIFPVEVSRNGTRSEHVHEPAPSMVASAERGEIAGAVLDAPAPPPPPVPEPEAASPAAAPEIAPAPAPADPAPPASAPRFGAQDPHSKARRLARALVSDMVIYHPERHERGLREGTLRKDFKEEIRKSWEEFVEQVGRDIAHGTPYFRDALNEILARGQKVF